MKKIKLFQTFLFVIRKDPIKGSFYYRGCSFYLIFPLIILV